LPGSDGSVAGFWLGLWHGLIVPISFFVSLLNGNVSLYEVHNNGGWYNLGFVLGVSWTLGSSGAVIRGTEEQSPRAASPTSLVLGR